MDAAKSNECATAASQAEVTYPRVYHNVMELLSYLFPHCLQFFHNRKQLQAIANFYSFWAFFFVKLKTLNVSE